jgi:hypothetical protein
MSKEIPLEHIAVGKGNCFSMCLLFDPYFFMANRGRLSERKPEFISRFDNFNCHFSVFSGSSLPLKCEKKQYPVESLPLFFVFIVRVK